MKLIKPRLPCYLVLYLVLKLAHSQVGQMDKRYPQSLLARNICYRCKTTLINKYTGETTCAEYIESCCPGFEGIGCDVGCFDCRKFQQLEKRYELIYYKMKYFQEKLTAKNDSEEEQNSNNGNNTDIRSNNNYNDTCACKIGPQGKRGPPGPQGPRGPPGIPGLPEPNRTTETNDEIEGNGPSCRTDNTGLLSNGSMFQCPPGRDGSPGPKGSQGEPGRDGMPGHKGQPGEIGPPGLPGSIGPKGSQGEKGEVGPKGETGPMGPEGKSGPKGSYGPQGPPGEPGMLGVDTDVFKRLADELQNLSQEFSKYKVKVLEHEEMISELKSRNNSTAPATFPFSTSTSSKHAQSVTTTEGYVMESQGDVTVSTKNNGVAEPDFLLDLVVPARKQTIPSERGCFNCREAFERYRQMIMKGFFEPQPLASVGTLLRAKQCRILKKLMRGI